MGTFPRMQRWPPRLVDIETYEDWAIASSGRIISLKPPVQL
jgi:hypothetical protein